MIIKAFDKHGSMIARLETGDEDVAFHATLGFLEACHKVTLGEHSAVEDDYYGIPGFNVDGIPYTKFETDQAISLNWFRQSVYAFE